MDALKLEHQRELASYKQAKDNAQDKLRRFMEYASSIEEERDSCRDALLNIVQKVEEDNDFTALPKSRIQLPDFLEPIHDIAKPRSTTKPTTPVPENGDTAKALVIWLRSELETERMSHIRTHEQAEREIFTLRAQLAQRDAELAACVAHPDHTALLAAAVPRAPIAPDAVPTILGITAARNRALEAEVRQLSEKLHAAQQPSRPRTPRSPALRPLEPHDVLSPYAMTPRGAAPPPPSTASDSTVRAGGPSEAAKLAAELDALGESIDVLGAQRRLARAYVDGEKEEIMPEEAQKLARDVAVLGEGIDNLGVQRRLARAVVEERNPAEIELTRTKEAAAARERELLAQIAQLQEMALAPAERSLLDDDDEQSMALGSPIVPGVVLWAETPPKDGLEEEKKREDEDEVDMSLVVPLPPSPPSSPDAWRNIYHRPPTPFASSSSSSSSSSDAEPELDETIHNDAAPTSEQDAPISISTISNCSCAAHLRTLERDLEATKQAVAARDEELVALRRAVTELRLAAMGR